MTLKEKGLRTGKSGTQRVPDQHIRRSGTVAVVCGPFTQLQHGVGGVEWGGDVVQSERPNTKMPCAHHMPLHTQEIGKKKAIRVQFGEKISVGGGGCFFFREGGPLAWGVHWHGGGRDQD